MDLTLLHLEKNARLLGFTSKLGANWEQRKRYASRLPLPLPLPSERRTKCRVRLGFAREQLLPIRQGKRYTQSDSSLHVEL